MKLNKKFFTALKKQIDKDFGKECWTYMHHNLKNYSPLCACCQANLAYHSLRDLYEIDYKRVKFIKSKKNEKQSNRNVKAVKSNRGNK
jgi:hypothetical protein